MKTNTINKKEIEKFSKIAEEWWDPTGKFKPLHKFNPIRISYIKENILSTFKIKKEKTKESRADDKTKTIQELDREKLDKKFSKEDKEKLN